MRVNKVSKFCACKKYSIRLISVQDKIMHGMLLQKPFLVPLRSKCKNMQKNIIWLLLYRFMKKNKLVYCIIRQQSLMRMEPFWGNTGKTIFPIPLDFGKNIFSNLAIWVIQFLKQNMQKWVFIFVMIDIIQMGQGVLG